VAGREIRPYYQPTDLPIRKYRQVIMEMAEGFESEDLSNQSSVIGALQQSSEAYLASIYAEKVAMMSKYIQLARRIHGERS